MFGFVDTRRQKPVSGVEARKASVSAATSIGITDGRAGAVGLE